MKKLIFVIGLAVQITQAYCQEDSIKNELDEVIVYANKFAEKQKNLSQKVELISSREIDFINAQNTGDLLINTGKVFVQKSQQGGSSPVIRGFEASRVLLVVDGVRMNNAIYRSGHLQNVITVDQNMLERMEVLFGPASTLYGSDALGGVIQLFTKRPFLSGNKNFLSKHQAFTRYSSANSEKTFHYNGSLGGKKIGWLQSFTYSDFGDLKMGKNYPNKFPDFGRRTHYITNINGIDSVVENPDDRVQKYSGYKQWDITQKIFYKPSDRFSHLINFQLSNSTNIPRYDRLQDTKNGNLRFAEWYYGPQKRILASYEFNMKNLFFLEEVKAIASYQKIKESRHSREYRRYDAFDHRMEDLDVWGFTLDGRKRWAYHELVIGMDGQVNNLKSTAHRTNLLTNTKLPLDTRYPNGDNRMNYFAVYAQHILKMMNDKLILNDGIRLQTVNLQSTITDNSFFNFPYTKISQNNFAVTGNLGLVYMPVQDLRFSLNLASGFRAPNIDDQSKIFESSTILKQVVFPNPDIKPEYTYNIDFNIGGKIKGIQLDASIFYTWFRNAISLAPFAFNGRDSILFNGVTSAVYANQNKSQAFMYGFQTNILITLNKNFAFSGTVSYTHGRFKEKNGYTSPADHIPPLFGKASLNYIKEKWQLEVYSLYNGWKRIEDYNLSGEDNQQYATPAGMPAWITLNAKTSYEINSHLQIQGGIENILDLNYRHFASGFSSPGRNFIITLRGSF